MGCVGGRFRLFWRLLDEIFESLAGLLGGQDGVSKRVPSQTLTWCKSLRFSAPCRMCKEKLVIGRQRLG